MSLTGFVFFFVDQKPFWQHETQNNHHQSDSMCKITPHVWIWLTTRRPHGRTWDRRCWRDIRRHPDATPSRVPKLQRECSRFGLSRICNGVWPHAPLCSHVPPEQHLQWHESRKPWRETRAHEDVDFRLRWCLRCSVRCRMKEWGLVFDRRTFVCLFSSLCFHVEPFSGS